MYRVTGFYVLLRGLHSRGRGRCVSRAPPLTRSYNAGAVWGPALNSPELPNRGLHPV